MLRTFVPELRDRRALQRWSAVALYVVLIPLSFAVELDFGGWSHHGTLLLVTTAFLLSQAVACAVWGDGMPGWGWTMLVAALPAAFAMDAVVSPGAAATLAPLLVVPVGWVALFLGARLVALCIALNLLALSALLVVEGAPGGGHIKLAVDAVAVLLVGLIVHGVVAALDVARLRAEERADTDPLTGARSRSASLDALDAAVGRADREHVGVLVIDLDFFKTVNDQYGHLAGDHVLRTVASELRRQVRERDMVGRVGGEEFLVMVHDVESSSDVRGIAEKLRTATERTPITAHDTPIAQTISVGAVFVDAAASSRDVIASADHALYAAKLGGRNQTRIASIASRTASGSRTLPGDEGDGRRQRVTERLPRDASALHGARETLGRLSPPLSAETAADAQMLVTELVASRLFAEDAISPFIDLVLERRGAQLLIQITDAGYNVAPRTTAAATVGLAGLGLAIVGELASEWGTHTDESTRIWAQLPATPASPAG